MGTITISASIAVAVIIVFILVAGFYSNKTRKRNIETDLKAALAQEGVDISTLDPATVNSAVSSLNTERKADTEADFQMKSGASQEETLKNAEMYLDAKYSRADGARVNAGFFRPTKDPLLVIALAIFVGSLAAIVVFAIFWEHLIYYAYIFGAVALLAILLAVNPAGAGKMLYIVLMVACLGGAAMLSYFGISEIIYAANLDKYEQGEITTRLS